MEINFRGKKRKYRLTSDGSQLILSESRKAKTGKSAGQIMYYPVGYFCKIEDTLQKVLNLEISDSDATTFPELLSAIRETRDMIDRVVSDNATTSKEMAV